MGIVLSKQGKLDAYKKALSINPNDAEIYCNMGNTLVEQDKLEEALDLYDKALNIRPKYYQAYENALRLFKLYNPKNQKIMCCLLLTTKLRKTVVSLF